MKKAEAYALIRQWFEEHEDAFNDVIEELDAWNGYLGDSRYYPMDELDEFCVGMTPTEILQRAFFGYDEDTWTGEGGT